MTDSNDPRHPAGASPTGAPPTGDRPAAEAESGETVDRARRRLLGMAVYVPPAVLGIISLHQAGCQPAPSCNPDGGPCVPSGAPCVPDGGNCGPGTGCGPSTSPCTPNTGPPP